MSKEAKRYELLKDLPNINAGTELEWKNQSYGCFDKNGFTATLNKMLVEQNPSWFKEILPETKSGLIGVSIRGNVVDYKNSASLKLDEDGLPTAISMNGIIFLPEKPESKDVFTWTDELVKEFWSTVYSTPVMDKDKEIKKFKQSKQSSIDTKRTEMYESMTEDDIHSMISEKTYTEEHLIEVNGFEKGYRNDYYRFKTSLPIPEYKFNKVVKAIEAVLNNEIAPQAEDQLNKAREDAFNGARECISKSKTSVYTHFHDEKYATFEDYKNAETLTQQGFSSTHNHVK